MTADRSVEIITSMRDVLKDPVRWHKGANARDSQGREVDGKDRSAVSWCLVGCTKYVLTDAEIRAYYRGFNTQSVSDALIAMGLASNKKLVALGGRYPERSTVCVFNDFAVTTHADVMEMLDDSLAYLRRPGFDLLVAERPFWHPYYTDDRSS